MMVREPASGGSQTGTVRRICCEIQHKSLEFQHLFHGGDIQTSYPFFFNNIPDVSS
jgi:hypothetical protein